MSEPRTLDPSDVEDWLESIFPTAQSLEITSSVLFCPATKEAETQTEVKLESVSIQTKFNYELKRDAVTQTEKIKKNIANVNSSHKFLNSKQKRLNKKHLVVYKNIITEQHDLELLLIK